MLTERAAHLLPFVIELTFVKGYVNVFYRLMSCNSTGKKYLGMDRSNTQDQSLFGQDFRTNIEKNKQLQPIQSDTSAQMLKPKPNVTAAHCMLQEKQRYRTDIGIGRYSDSKCQYQT